MPDDTTNNTTTTSDGTDADSATDGSTTDATTAATTQQQNTSQNDPAKNKKLAEITMSEPFRELMSFEITLPGIYRGMRTNQFLWIDVAEDFYDDFYGEIAGIIGPNKFNRYAGFKEGRFYIEKKTWKYDLKNGVTTELQLNPFPSPYSEYMKYQLEAERALDQAIIDATRNTGGSTASATNVSGEDCSSNTHESDAWAGHKCKPPICTDTGKQVHGNSSRTYAKDTASHNTSSKDLVTFVASQCQYQSYADNKYGEAKCPEALWTGGRPIRGNCADFARLLKCILDVNGYNSIICHIPMHFYNAIWENNGWTVCDICTLCYNSDPSYCYGHANHGNVKPSNTWDNPQTSTRGGGSN